MIAAFIWIGIFFVVHVLIKQGKLRSVGYNYGRVVCDGEWWRLLVRGYSVSTDDAHIAGVHSLPRRAGSLGIINIDVGLRGVEA